MSKRKFALLLIVGVLVTFGLLIYILRGSIVSPKACPLPDLVTRNIQPEDLLILEGRCVVPTAIVAIEDRELPKRWNIMSFLGNGAYPQALPILTRIVEDETERDRDRSVALIAVFRIDNVKGLELASRYNAENGELGKVSGDVMANKSYLHDRQTYWQAWRNYIDYKYAF